MSSERETEVGSFQGHLDEIVTRLAYEGVVGAGTARPAMPLKRTSEPAARCPAYHNQALFEGADD